MMADWTVYRVNCDAVDNLDLLRPRLVALGIIVDFFALWRR
jgi:hypothetical protein